jgi:hypothetical protein
MQAVTDTQDAALIADRMAALKARKGPQVGEFVRFADGTMRRISYHWTDDAGWDGGVQTSDGGSFHLGEYGISFSGSLYSTIPTDELKPTDETLPGSVWVFHHGFPGAGRGVDTRVDMRVWTYDGNAPSS